MILKNYILEKNINLLDNYNMSLLYGENIGFKNDIKIKIKKNTSNCEFINLFENEIIKNESILYNFINNTSLFDPKKVVFINEVTDKFFKILMEITTLLGTDTKIILLSSLLDKKSKIRNYFEKDKQSVIIACYQDNERSLQNYINTNLKDFKGINGEVTNLIIENSNLNRQVIKIELSKIKSFFKDKIINKNQLMELLNIKINEDFNFVRDASLLGNKKKVNQLIGEMEFLSEDNFYYLNLIAMRLNKLLEILIIKESIGDIDMVLEGLKPKIFWKDKPIVLEQLRKWNLNKLEVALSEINKTEMLMKKSSQIRNDLLVKSLIIELCNQANDSLAT